VLDCAEVEALCGVDQCDVRIGCCVAGACVGAGCSRALCHRIVAFYIHVACDGFFVGHPHGMQERDPYVYDHGVSTPT
jgi:hypothetical protein